MRAGKKPTEPKPTGTDWQRVKNEAAADAAMAHEPTADADPHDPNDPAALAAFWASANIKRGPGRPPSTLTRPPHNMRADADVLAAFKATGLGWQTRINALLRDAVTRGAVKG